MGAESIAFFSSPPPSFSGIGCRVKDTVAWRTNWMVSTMRMKPTGAEWKRSRPLSLSSSATSTNKQKHQQQTDVPRWQLSCKSLPNEYPVLPLLLLLLLLRFLHIRKHWAGRKAEANYFLVLHLLLVLHQFNCNSIYDLLYEISQLMIAPSLSPLLSTVCNCWL